MPDFQSSASNVSDKINELIRWAPKLVRWQVDPDQAVRGCVILKTLGVSKPFFTSPQKFVTNCILGDPFIYGHFSSEIILTDIKNGHSVKCWSGGGHKIDRDSADGWRKTLAVMGMVDLRAIGTGTTMTIDIEDIQEHLKGLIQE